jgi:hypothetical protein
MAVLSVLKKKRTLVLIVVLLPVLLVAAIWLCRDRFAIALMERELRRRPAVQVIPLPAQDPAQLDRLRAYLVNDHQTPEDYILSKFDNHDIVFVGEHHRIKHDVELIHRLIPLLYERGVHNLGFEFADAEDQTLIDALITAEEYDGESANRLLFHALVTWGYQEYADVFKVAWDLNRNLPQGASKFRVVGLHAPSDWSHVRSAEDRHDERVLAKVWGGSPGDQVMAETVLREIVERNGKALVYCGIHHAFTRYRQPSAIGSDGEVEDYFDRMGNLVYDEIGDRAITIALHTSWQGRRSAGRHVYPVNGAIDALMKQVPPQYRRAGFDTRGTPFGELEGGPTVYAYGRDDFVLADFCDGYVFQAPFPEYENVTPIPGFINRGNIDEAKEQEPNPRFRTGRWRYLGPDFMNRLIAENGTVEEMSAMFE